MVRRQRHRFRQNHKGEFVFVHVSVVRGAEALDFGIERMGASRERPRSAEGVYRARKEWGKNAWKEERDKEKANRVAQQVRRAAALTAELGAQSEKKVSAVCDHLAGLLSELAEHIEALNVGAGGSHSQATMMQEESAAPAATSHHFATSAVGSPVPATQSLRAARGVFGTWKEQDVTRGFEPRKQWSRKSVGFFVEPTGKCADSIRLELSTQESGRLASSSSVLRRVRAEEKERLPDKEEEAWELFSQFVKPQTQDEERVRERLQAQCAAWSVP